MPQLVGVDHPSHRLYEAIDDIERDDAHGMPGGVKSCGDRGQPLHLLRQDRVPIYDPFPNSPIRRHRKTPHLVLRVDRPNKEAHMRLTQRSTVSQQHRGFAFTHPHLSQGRGLDRETPTEDAA